ncbi:hypothetical protein HBH76_081570 [Parastagonospora nodorum]|nr:hypothetical protein HBH76_081570 [Parastagonospora nodorum]
MVAAAQRRSTNNNRRNISSMPVVERKGSRQSPAWPRQQPSNVETQYPTSASGARDVYEAYAMMCNSATCTKRLGVVEVIPSSQVMLQSWRFEAPPQHCATYFSRLQRSSRVSVFQVHLMAQRCERYALGPWSIFRTQATCYSCRNTETWPAYDACGTEISFGPVQMEQRVARRYSRRLQMPSNSWMDSKEVLGCKYVCHACGNQLCLADILGTWTTVLASCLTQCWYHPLLEQVCPCQHLGPCCFVYFDRVQSTSWGYPLHADRSV